MLPIVRMWYSTLTASKSLINMITALSILTLACYCFVTVMLVRTAKQQDADKLSKRLVMAVLSLGVIMHLILSVQYSGLLATHGPNFSLSSMTILIGAIVTLLFLIGCSQLPILRLGLIILPVNIVCLSFALAWQSKPLYLTTQSTAMIAHILIAILTYSLISLATIQVILYAYQEKQLKARKEPSLLLALPPLQTMEALFFKLLTAGFIMLSLTLVTGVMFSQQFFSHHIVLTGAAWCLFAYLLYRHYQHGLRGSQALKLTIVGFILIQLGYFGTKLVLESL